MSIIIDQTEQKGEIAFFHALRYRQAVDQKDGRESKLHQQLRIYLLNIRI